MTRPEFKPGPPKSAAGITLRDLKKRVSAGDKVEGAKSVGSGTVKLFMSGDTNFYISDGQQLQEYLWKTFKVGV